MQQKIIVIEGTDSTGKQTQTELLCKKLLADGVRVKHTGFPMYDTPSGRIIGGPFLGKERYGHSYFLEGSSNVSPKVSGLYYAADRYYNLPYIQEMLLTDNLIIDRYVGSNMAYQGAKIKDKAQRQKMYKWFDKFEYDMLGLPRPDITILLYVPWEFAKVLIEKRAEAKDDNEKDDNLLQASERAYLELAKLYNYKIINCIENGKLRDIEDINNEIYRFVISKLS